MARAHGGRHHDIGAGRVARNERFEGGSTHAAGEIDDRIDGIPVEVTTGKERDELTQLEKVRTATGEIPILYAPNITEGRRANIEAEGFTVVGTLEELGAAVRRARGDDAG